MEEISKAKFSFWSCLNKNNPDLHSIEDGVKSAIEGKKQINKKIEEGLRLFAYSTSVMELLCVYEVYVKLTSKLPKYLIESQQKTSIMKIEKIKVLKNQNFKIDTLMYEKYCVVFESRIEKNNMGIILNVSKNISKVFGYMKEDIIGQNIN